MYIIILLLKELRNFLIMETTNKKTPSEDNKKPILKKKVIEVKELKIGVSGGFRRIKEDMNEIKNLVKKK